ncbi:MAG: hypothetical protein ABIQ95_03605 [Bdellovibrionia bacterium]
MPKREQLCQTNGIAISGNDIYAAGYETISGVNVAKYWKNGVATSLTNGSQSYQGTAIAVMGSDVYVAGYQTLSGFNRFTATYWKNGVANTVTATFSSQLFGVALVCP